MIYVALQLQFALKLAFDRLYRDNFITTLLHIVIFSWLANHYQLQKAVLFSSNAYISLRGVVPSYTWKGISQDKSSLFLQLFRIDMCIGIVSLLITVDFAGKIFYDLQWTTNNEETLLQDFLVIMKKDITIISQAPHSGILMVETVSFIWTKF